MKAQLLWVNKIWRSKWVQLDYSMAISDHLVRIGVYIIHLQDRFVFESADDALPWLNSVMLKTCVRTYRGTLVRHRPLTYSSGPTWMYVLSGEVGADPLDWCLGDAVNGVQSADESFTFDRLSRVRNSGLKARVTGSSDSESSAVSQLTYHFTRQMFRFIDKNQK